MSSYELDASAVLALLNSEPGSELVTQAVTAGAVMSTVNLSEVVAKLSDAGMIEEKVREVIDLLGIQFSVFDARAAYQAGVLRPQTRAAGLSLDDRACLALAKDLGIPAVTTDRARAALPLGVTIRLARPARGTKRTSRFLCNVSREGRRKWLPAFSARSSTRRRASSTNKISTAGSPSCASRRRRVIPRWS